MLRQYPPRLRDFLFFTLLVFFRLFIVRVAPTVLVWAVVSGNGAYAQAPTPVNAPTWRYDNTHAGQNTQETALTPQNVTAGSFGKLFSLAVDGRVYAQPLYISGITMADGQVHNVIFVATEHDSLYAFDADTNGGSNAQPLWQISLLTPAYGAAPGATTVPSTDLGTTDLVPEIGVTGTPVINPATQTLYVVGKTKENGSYFQRLHAINMITGAEMPNSPVAILGSVPGAGNGSSGGQLPWSAIWSHNRAALDYYNGYIYIPFGSHGDNGIWHGWIMVYNATTLVQTGVVSLSPDGYGNGVWESGAAMPIDHGPSFDRIFAVTGNGTYSNASPLTARTNFGNSIAAFNVSNGGLVASDSFTTFNQQALSTADADQGSGGILMLPDQAGSYPHMLVQIGKEGRILVLNRDNLGGYVPGGTNNPNILQDIPNVVKGLWSTPAYWNGNVYIWGSSDAAHSFPITGGFLDTTSGSVSTVRAGFPGPSFVISSNGTQNGIAWAARGDLAANNGSDILYAFDATNLGKVLWESDLNARDDAGPANKFNVPVITNGKVYLAVAYQVDVYGLIGGVPVTAAPVISPNGGSFLFNQTVTLASTTLGANIYYTLDGSVPTVASNLYSAPFTITSTTTVRAIASAAGNLQSAAVSAYFPASNQAPPVVPTPAGGVYNTFQQVSLSDPDTATSIYYTLDGTTPTAASTPYTGPITVAATTTINAIAIDPALQLPSNVVSSVYTIAPTGAFINFGSGFASVAGLQLNGSAVNSDDSRLQLTTGGPTQAGSAFYTQKINIQSFVTDFTFQLSNALADGFTFAIQNMSPAALGQTGSALGYGSAPSTAAILNSVAVKFDFHNNAGEGNDSTGIYINGASPTVPAVDMTSSGVVVGSGDVIKANITYDGTTLTMILNDVAVGKTFTYSQAINIPATVGSNTAYVGFTGGSGGSGASQKIITWTFAAQAAANAAAAPLFSVASGSYTAPQSVALASATSGASIYYTTDGTNPTTSSKLYAGPVTIGYGNTTLQAIAVASGLSQSATSTASYSIVQPTTPAPVLSQASGTYPAPLSITITDSDPSAAIYYTLDGTTPTASSTVYSAPISLTASAVVKAIALDPAMQISAVVSATYAVTSGTAGGINFASGFPSSIGLKLNGSAAVANNLLQLTAAINQAGSAFWTTPVNIQTFNSTFTFQLINPLADGFTFTIQQFGPTAIGSNGSSLGFGSTTVKSGMTASSMALKFDFHNNAGEGNNSTGLYYNGAVPTVPAITIPTSTVVLGSGDTMQAAMTYNGTTLTLLLTDLVTNKTFTQSFTVNIPQVVGGSTAYVGFTGGTGGSSATQNVLKWTFVGQAPIAATPAFSPAAGSYTSPQNVAISSATTGAVLYYTLDGTTPTTASAVYSAPVAISSGNTTLQAIATAPGMSQSSVGSAVYSITQSVAPTPVISPSAGNYSSPQTVAITDSSASAVIYYTLDGTQPTTASAVYSVPLNIGYGNTTLQAIATATGLSQSSVSSAAYSIVQSASPAPLISAAGGNYTSPQSVILTDSNASAVIYYTLDGTQPTSASAVYSAPVNIGYGNTTLRAIAVVSGMSQSPLSSAAYSIVQPATPAPLFSATGGNYTSPQSVILTDSNASAVIYYTLDGTQPTTASAVYSIPLNIGYGNTTLQAIATATGLSQSPVSSATYSIAQPVTPAPLISAAGGNYTAPQNVTLADSNASAVIYYTLDGTQPTTASAVYGGPLNIGYGNTTLQAIAIATGMLQSPLSSATYSIVQPVTPAPLISAAAGNYTTPQNVTLADSNASAVIYYTLDGTQPTTASAVYGSPISIVYGNTTLQAIAIASGMLRSPISSAAYSIVQQVTPAPVLSAPAGAYPAPQSVVIADSNASAVIYYTLDGSSPTTASAVYGAPVTIGFGNTTLQAIAIAPGMLRSAVSGATYSIVQSATPTPVISPNAGTYPAPQGITIADSDLSAVIYYTLDGTQPTTSSAIYSAPISLTGSAVVTAIALDPAMQMSSSVSATYVINSISFNTGTATPAFSSSKGLRLNGSATVTGNVLQLASVINQAGSAFWTTPLNVQAFTTSFTFQMIKPVADGFTFAIQQFGPAALGSNGSSLGYGSSKAASGMTASSMALKFDFHNNAGEGTNSTGLYYNGAIPTVPAIAIPTTTVVLNSGNIIQALVTYDGTTLTLTLTDTVTSKTFTQAFTVNIPQIVGANTAYIGFTGGTGSTSATEDILNWTFSNPPAGQPNVKRSSSGMPSQQLNDEPLPATDPTSSEIDAQPETPSTSDRALVSSASSPTPAPVPTETLPKIGMAEPDGSQDVATEEVESARQAQEPRLIPAPGVLSGDTKVKLLCATPGAVIHYTVDGSQPTSDSPIYHSPVVVSGTALTIKAFASGPGQRDSAVITGNYRIQDR